MTYVPTVGMLKTSPELAILDSLANSLPIATNALFAANPELGDFHFIKTLPEPAVNACLAQAVLRHIDGLTDALESYRAYVFDLELRRRHNLKESDF
jgi:hypothetical protein